MKTCNNCEHNKGEVKCQKEKNVQYETTMTMTLFTECEDHKETNHDEYEPNAGQGSLS